MLPFLVFILLLASGSVGNSYRLEDRFPAERIGAESQSPAVDIFIRSERMEEGSVEVSVGNAGRGASTLPFDASVEVKKDGRILCRASTNFVTPLDSGTVVRAFRIEVGGSMRDPATRYQARSSVSFPPGAGDGNPANDQQTIDIVTAESSVIRCVTLKPRQ